MFRLDARKGFLFAALSASLAALAAPAAEAQINLTPGDVALIGWVDNGSPNDAIALVALADLPAGTAIYFTDNGWDNVSGAFRNTNGPTDGNGNETLMMLTANVLIPAGTILDTTQTNPAFTWTTSGAIPGATSGTFGYLVLTQSGDQVYAFQQDSGQNPMNTGVRQHLFVLDDTGTFEDATTTGEGNVPPGLSVAGNTALTFAQSGSGQNFMGFNTAALPSGTKADWLAAIHDPVNWAFGATGTLPSGTITVTTGPISTFCYGDGTLATACPCGNNGLAGRGCENSAHGGGAQLTATGSPSPDTVVLTSSGQIASGSTFFLQGNAEVTGGIVFGDGLRCAGGTLKRIAFKHASNGSATYPEAGDPSISAVSAQLGDPIPSGGLRYYQTLYRDRDAAFCPNPPGNNWNMSSAVRIVW
jgi:hypothetical protein